LPPKTYNLGKYLPYILIDLLSFMKKNYITLLLLVSLSNYAFSQTAEPQNKVPLTTTIPSETKAVPVLEKIPLPAQQKTTPEAIYIINDKPVTRQQYQEHLQRTTSKN